MTKPTLSALAALAALSACTPTPAGDPVHRAHHADTGAGPLEVDTAQAPAPQAAAEEQLVSRFAPETGVRRSRVTILTTFDSAGCAAEGRCTVTFGEVPAMIVDDTFVLEVEVPLGAATGALCVTADNVVDCAGAFTVLEGPLLRAVEHTRAAGEARLTLWGDGFQGDSQVWVDGTSLETEFHGQYRLDATLPQTLAEADGAHEVRVYSPTSGRCGAWSEPLPLALD